MSGEESRFTSDRRSPAESSWTSDADWAAGAAENVDIANGRLVGQASLQSSQPSSDRELYNEGGNKDSWVEGNTKGDPYSPLGGVLTKKADHLFADPVSDPDGTNAVSWVYKSKIDFSNYSEIAVEASSEEFKGILHILISPEVVFEFNNSEYNTIFALSNQRETKTFDVSDFSSAYYLHLVVRDNSPYSRRRTEVEFYYVGLNA